ncbi:CXADR-like membrane protein isoform X2 [Chrysemys picta bellii]|uniref:CXADR-like membrane protein isoform X2 n=1 Tax=Chrysemys picta bellii TaxID=8478 RepID=UPI0032B21705
MQLRSVHSRGVPLNSVQVCLPFLGERKKKGGKVSLSPGDGMSALSILFLASCSVWMSGAQTEFKRVAEENVTLPCHHRLGLLEPRSLDIEWLLHDSKADQKVVITYSGGNVYNDLNEGQKGRVSFTSNFLAGDASLRIVSLQPSDAGQYTCKVKNAGQYEWYRITLFVLEKPSKPKCWVEGELFEGKELSLQCNSASGTAPIKYQWQRISDKEGKIGHLPPTARVNISNPGQVLMKNLTQMITGLYQCTASNDAGQETCVVQVTVQSVNFSSLPPPPRRLSQIRRRKKQTRDEMFSEIMESTRNERAHLNEWKDTVSKYRKNASEREDRRDQREEMRDQREDRRDQREERRDA